MAYPVKVRDKINKKNMRQFGMVVNLPDNSGYMGQEDIDHYVRESAIQQLAKEMINSGVISSRRMDSPLRNTISYNVLLASPEASEMYLENENIMYDGQLFSFRDVEKALDATFPERFL